jgi:hypothetical protein
VGSQIQQEKRSRRREVGTRKNETATNRDAAPSCIATSFEFDFISLKAPTRFHSRIRARYDYAATQGFGTLVATLRSAASVANKGSWTELAKVAISQPRCQINSANASFNVARCEFLVSV